MNSVSDNSRINTGEAVGVVVRVKDSEKSKIKTNSTTLNENLQKKQNYEVCMFNILVLLSFINNCFNLFELFFINFY